MDDVVSRPEFYFMRVETARTDRDIIGAKAEWYKWASLLNQNSLLNRWPMNPSACYGMFGKCPYFDICSNNVDVSNGLPDGFIKVVDVHPELVAN